MITNVLNVILSAVVSGFWSQSPQTVHKAHKGFLFAVLRVRLFPS